MAEETKKSSSKQLEDGFYKVTFTGKNGTTKDEERIYHSSTAKALEAKGMITIGDKVKKYVPEGAQK